MPSNFARTLDQNPGRTDPDTYCHPGDAVVSELEGKKAAFDLPERFFYAGSGTRDLSLQLHGARAATPFGPAAGPHTQLAQNIVLAWLCGGRFMELKTVQVMEDLHIPRPCIDMQTVGFNVEWSQELKLTQSLEE